jgi:hypothetical protein
MENVKTQSLIESSTTLINICNVTERDVTFCK